MMIQLLHAAFVYQSPDGEVEALRRKRSSGSSTSSGS